MKQKRILTQEGQDLLASVIKFIGSRIPLQRAATFEQYPGMLVNLLLVLQSDDWVHLLPALYENEDEVQKEKTAQEPTLVWLCSGDVRKALNDEHITPLQIIDEAKHNGWDLLERKHAHRLAKLVDGLDGGYRNCAFLFKSGKKKIGRYWLGSSTMGGMETDKDQVFLDSPDAPEDIVYFFTRKSGVRGK